MPVIVVTRLRLKDPALLDEFFTAAVAAIEQAQKSDGNLGADALADAGNAWWSVSASTISATSPPSSTGSRTAPTCRTGRPAGATSPPTARWQHSPTPRTQTRP